MYDMSDRSNMLKYMAVLGSFVFCLCFAKLVVHVIQRTVSAFLAKRMVYFCAHRQELKQVPNSLCMRL
jgi:uncharacterized membrane protein YjjP (DUF1212 family)